MRAILCLLALHCFGVGAELKERDNYLDKCKTLNDAEGLCISVKYCPEVTELTGSQTKRQARSTLRELSQRCRGAAVSDNHPVVCCGNIVKDGIAFNAPLPEYTTTTPKMSTAPMTSNLSTTTIAPIMPVEEDGLNDNCTIIQDGSQSHAVEFRTLSRNCDEIYIKKPRKTYGPGKGTVFGIMTRSALPLEDRDEGNCGRVGLNMKDLSDGEAQIGSWPWMALIAYEQQTENQSKFRCGGTLITDRHVITAAHCVMIDEPLSVRLGEFDQSTDNETKHLDVNVSHYIAHSDYQRRHGRYFDIAIVYLAEKVKFTELIRPICLPLSGYFRSKTYVDSNPYVAGWGKTELKSISQVLRQVRISVLDNRVCYESYKKLKKLESENQFDESVICAGAIIGGLDACEGDSGGPLMISEPYKGILRYYLIGIISYGYDCAQHGVPAVYSSTNYFIDWIEQKVTEG